MLPGPRSCESENVSSHPDLRAARHNLDSHGHAVAGPIESSAPPRHLYREVVRIVKGAATCSCYQLSGSFKLAHLPAM